ncbi:MAG: fliA, partial [Frankiales bacterium]|nr:fliA [Frankiales bacterium]
MNVHLTLAPPLPETEFTAVSVDELCRTHLALVHYEVRSLAVRLPRHVNQDDLVSAGMAA